MTNGWELISFLYKFISSKKKKIIKRCDTNLIKIVNIYENIIKNNNVSMTRKGKKKEQGMEKMLLK